jgi:lactoylglutathione lyase
VCFGKSEGRFTAEIPYHGMHRDAALKGGRSAKPKQVLNARKNGLPMPNFPFAKPAFDVGFTTNAIEAHQAFWGEQVGLTFDHMAKLGGGFQQHRRQQGASIIKVNHTRAPLPDLALHVVANDLNAFSRFYGEHLGLEPDGPSAFRLGRSRIVATQGDAPRIDGWREKGLRYMTVQIFECDALTAALQQQGVEVGMAPKTVGQVRYSFIRDPDGNWIELSERGSLTGRPIPAE